MELKIDPLLNEMYKSQDQKQKSEFKLKEEKGTELKLKKAQVRAQQQKPKPRISKNKDSNYFKDEKWTEIEDLAFFDALKSRKYGDWMSIAAEIKSRNTEQVKMRAIGTARNLNANLAKLITQVKFKIKLFSNLFLFVEKKGTRS